MAGGVCPFTLTRAVLYHTLLTGTLLLVVTSQGILLDVYIVANDHTANVNYFWLLPDFLMTFVFVAVMAGGYQKYKMEKIPEAERSKAVDNSQMQQLHLRVLGPHALPFYVWMAYSVLLVTKVAIIFKSEMPSKVDSTDSLSPQLLKVTISTTAIVFALLVEGQTDTKPNSDRELYIKSLSHGSALEILDSVTFLALLIQSESKLVLPLHLENAIIALACLNFFLPGLALVKLSRSDYGRSTVCIVSSMVYKLCHLWLINFTFFIIRVYLWAGLSASVSPFVVKNIYHMFSVMKQVYADYKQLRVVIGRYLIKRRRVFSSGNPTGGAELNAGNSSLDWTANGDKFEEIDLKQDCTGSP